MRNLEGTDAIRCFIDLARYFQPRPEVKTTLATSLQYRRELAPKTRAHFGSALPDTMSLQMEPSRRLLREFTEHRGVSNQELMRNAEEDAIES